MNREYNRTGSEKSSRILPGPMMLGWPSHRRAMTASCIHVLAPNQKFPKPPIQRVYVVRRHADITVSFLKRKSIITVSSVLRKAATRCNHRQDAMLMVLLTAIILNDAYSMQKPL